jgi:hypothetical protein
MTLCSMEKTQPHIVTNVSHDKQVENLYHALIVCQKYYKCH